MKTARRIAAIPPYLFAELDRKREEARARGVDVIDLGIGDPDQPTPEPVVERLRQEAGNPAWHRYPSYEGAAAFRQAVAEWYEGRFGVRLDPATQVMTLIGSKEGLAHIVWAFVDPGDIALVPDPAYPVYRTHVLLAGGRPYLLPLRPERDFLPDLTAVPRDVADAAKILFLNYPNNPTAAVADLAFFEEAVDFCRRHDVLLCHDAAYSETTFDGYVAPSVLQVPGAADVAVEFHSLSKPYNMTGWRLGFAVGNAAALRALGIIKTNTDSGQFTAIQYAGITALRDVPRSFVDGMNDVYRRRRDLVVEALNAMGIPVRPPRGTFYVWAPVPDGTTSAAFAARLLDEAGVIVGPGNAYGEHGEGFFRISLTTPDERLAEAVRRLRGLSA
ncbi:MAG: LL-diaminopimelate aminotransferase [Clostridia bacterium]|nr:LL-diaminopimelate aminotransferase [Clostridia bacterium]